MFAKNSPNSSSYPDFTKNKHNTDNNFALFVDWFDARNDGLNDKSTQAKIQHLRNRINKRDLPNTFRFFINAYDNSPTKLTVQQKVARRKLTGINTTTGYDY